MDCPNCKLINPEGALRCDCGYDFQTGEGRAEFRYWNDGLPEIVGGLGNLLLAATILLMAMPTRSETSRLFLMAILLVAQVLTSARGKAIVRKLRTKVTFPRAGYIELPVPRAAGWYEPLVWPEPEQPPSPVAPKRFMLRALATVGLIIGAVAVFRVTSLERFLPAILSLAMCIHFWKAKRQFYLWWFIATLISSIVLMLWHVGHSLALGCILFSGGLAPVVDGCLRLRSFLKSHPPAATAGGRSCRTPALPEDK